MFNNFFRNILILCIVLATTLYKPVGNCVAHGGIKQVSMHNDGVLACLQPTASAVSAAHAYHRSDHSVSLQYLCVEFGIT